MTEKNRQKAHLTKDLRLLLSSDFFYFRAQIKFYQPEKTPLTMYGDEHSVTYKQCVAGYAKQIELNATKGFKSLVDYIDKHSVARGGNIVSAQIYGRDDVTQPFDTIHRIFGRGKWLEKNDPIIPVDMNFRILDFKIERNRVEVTGLRDKNSPDFKNEIANALGVAPAIPVEKNTNAWGKAVYKEKISKVPVKKTAKKISKKTVAKPFEQDHSIY